MKFGKQLCSDLRKMVILFFLLVMSGQFIEPMLQSLRLVQSTLVVVQPIIFLFLCDSSGRIEELKVTEKILFSEFRFS